MDGLKGCDAFAEMGRRMVDTLYAAGCAECIRRGDAIGAVLERKRFEGNYGEMAGMMAYFDRRVKERLGASYG